MNIFIPKNDNPNIINKLIMTSWLLIPIVCSLFETFEIVGNLNPVGLCACSIYIHIIENFVIEPPNMCVSK